MKIVRLLVLTLLLPVIGFAYQPTTPVSGASDKMPSELEGVGVTEKLGEKIDLGLKFTADSGEEVTLGQYFGKDRPVIMAMIYYSCPNLCNFQLNGMVEAMRQMKGRAGVDYDLVAVSMDHTETATVASAKKESYVKALNQPGAENGWHFLVGSEANVKTLADQFGFRFKWSEELNQYAHSAATYVLTPEGTLSRYLHGIQFAPETLRFALIEASSGKVGTLVEQLALYCFQFNPAKNKYTLYAFNIMRVGAGLMVVLLAMFLVPVWLRERKRKALRT